VHGELSSLEKLRQVEKLKSWEGKKAKNAFALGGEKGC